MRWQRATSRIGTCSLLFRIADELHRGKSVTEKPGDNTATMADVLQNSCHNSIINLSQL